ncbi:MAG: Holliday junction branch migration protein RuvA [Gemmatimonadota bacterium]
MIARVRGALLRRDMDEVEVMTPGGVAYQIAIPISVFEKLPRPGAEIELRTVQVVREDAVLLFGFLDDDERALFSRLLTASGVGPRLALGMMSTLSPARLVRALAEKDTAVLVQVPGVGRKTAERIAVELSDKVNDLAVAASGARPQGRAAEGAVGALVSLGVSTADATSAVRRAIEADGPTDDPQVLIKRALAVASK